MFLKEITSFCLIVLPAIVLIRDWKFYDRRTKKHHYITRSIIILWVTIGFLSMFIIWKETHEINRLNSNVEKLSNQNVELIHGKNRLISQIQELKSKIGDYQDAITKLKERVKEERLKIFDLGQSPGSDGGIRLYNRKSAISVHFNSAVDYYKKGEVIAAKETLELILEEDPKHADSLHFLGLILNELGNSKEAMECLDKAYSLSKNPDILKNMQIIKRSPGRKLEIIE